MTGPARFAASMMGISRMTCARIVAVAATIGAVGGCGSRRAADPNTVDPRPDAATTGGGANRDADPSGTGAGGTGGDVTGTAGTSGAAGAGGVAVPTGGAVGAAGAGAGGIAGQAPRSPTFLLGPSYQFDGRDSLSAVKLADLNGDGNIDVACARAGGGAKVFLGNGDGSFATPASYPPDPIPLSSAVAIGDVNGDSKPDLAITNFGIFTFSPGTVSVLINNGDGTFARSASYGVGLWPSSVAIGDVDGDGQADIAVANGNSDDVSVLLNLGSGTFAAAVNFPAGDRPDSILMADLNGDARLDLTFATQSGVNVLMNRGNGTFAAPVNYVSGGAVMSVATGDVNGDGRIDLALAGNSSVTVLLNRGNGTFPNTAVYATGRTPTSVAIGDVNGDGKPDLAVANRDSVDVSVLLNNENGTFAPPVNYFNPGESVGIADFTGDGRPDLIVAKSPDTISVSPNRGSGAFAAPIVYAAGVTPQSITAGDIDGDGQADWAVANIFAGDVSVVLNKGNGVFTNAVTYPTGLGATAVAIGRIDDDGRTDIAVANSGGVPNTGMSNVSPGNVSVLFGNGAGTFGVALNLNAGTAPSGVAIGDLNGDGRADLAIANRGASGAGGAGGVSGASAGSVSVILSNGNRTFAAAINYPAGTMPSGIAVGDLDGDGKPDVAVANHGGGILGRPDLVSQDYGNVSVLLNNGNGALGAAINYPAGRGLTAITLVDLNGDGHPDLAVANQSSDLMVGYLGGVNVLLNNGNGTFAAPVAYPSGDFGPTTIAVGDLNGDGSVDLIGAGVGVGMLMLLNNGRGVFSTSVNHFLSGTGLSVGDLNGDAKPDLALVTAGGACLVLNTTP
jgi:FG-GAP-like repeat